MLSFYQKYQTTSSFFQKLEKKSKVISFKENIFYYKYFYPRTMSSTPPKNIENISVQLHLSDRNKFRDSQHKFKLQIQTKFNPITTIKNQRNLSPWNRKKDQLRERNNSINDDSNLHVISLLEKHNEPQQKSHTNSFDQAIMNDFLKKIHFTNRNRNSETKIPPSIHNNTQQNLIKNQPQSQNPNSAQNSINLTEEQIKKIIIYPKDFKPSEQKEKKKLNSIKKKNQFQTKKLATIQNFYDPYQNKNKINKKIEKYKLKLNDQLSQNNQTRANDSSISNHDFQISWRKNSMPQKNSHRRNFSMPQNQICNQKTVHVPDQNELKQTFFSPKTANFSKNFKTQPTQQDQKVHQNPQKDLTQTQTKSFHFEPTYATPSGQAIKRIKQQYKKSRKMKINDQKSQRTRFQTQPSLMQNDFYLYQTFLNYKNKKDSSGVNITKTLGFNFHNRQTFKQNIQKVWFKPKN